MYYLQVHPLKLTTALMTAAQQTAGAKLIIGTVNGITTTNSGAVSAVRVTTSDQQPQVTEQELAADAVVLAMGPWTGAARAWLPSAPATSGQKYHSVVLRGSVSDTAIFTAYRTADGRWAPAGPRCSCVLLLLQLGRPRLTCVFADMLLGLCLSVQDAQ